MLVLSHDVPSAAPTLEECLAASDGPAEVVAAIAAALPPLALRLAAGHLPGDPAAIVGVNDSGDRQKALDVAAHDHLILALKAAGARLVLSEEAEEVALLTPGGRWDVVIDPIDGSGSIGIGAPLGLLFAIYPAGPEGVLRRGREAVAAGYASFGHSLDFGFSLGQGVHVATWDPLLAVFVMTRNDLALAPGTKSIAYNASNERHWVPGLQRYAADLRAGSTGPRGKDFNMRWLAAAVGELHRILLQGGAFLYPADRRSGYENGRLRLCYEAVPIAFLIEQAGGRATDGRRDILDILPDAPHQHTPLVFGAADEVDTIAKYLAD
ncbi:class 1 fructose-bisphosphatase [Mangrovicoccus algicola]|uniref:Fructose-1,6-bisphosphatase class 1 n=1 Tax=Mangrovicoccus algicola TaxID=2771008 RepID=A0A8J6YV65_9RHOB|nr:fructose-bisphosphatase class I [Mangrovicoccus algicola]MBE3638227.1 fructose-bisphosphatase class I [Mangrovicoccus algicola]